MLYLKPNKNRPDFRTLIDFVWGENHNVDTEGDSYNPASRTWTELYAANRERKDETITVYSVTDEPLVLEISSSKDDLLVQVAMFLAKETEGTIYSDQELKVASDMEQLMKRIDVSLYEERLANSMNNIWRTSTLDNPYPNLKK